MASIEQEPPTKQELAANTSSSEKPEWYKQLKDFARREHLALAAVPPSLFMANWVLFQPGSWKAGSFPGELERMERYVHKLGRVPLFKGFSLTDFDGNSYAHKFAAFPSIRFSHSFMALPWSILLPLQLSVTVRKNFPALHRFGGRSFVFSSVAMIFGYIQIERNRLFYSLDKNKQLPLVIASALRAMIVWFTYTLFRAFTAIRNRQIKEHEIWMLRHIASGTWVILGRGVFMPLLIWTKQYFGIGDVTAVESKKMHFDHGHLMSIVFCLVTCEWYIRKYKAKPRTKKINTAKKTE